MVSPNSRRFLADISIVQACLDPTCLFFEERGDLALTLGTQTTLRRCDGESTDRSAVRSTDRNTDGPRVREKHAKFESIASCPCVLNETTKRRRRERRILVGENVCIGRQYFFHIPVGQGGEQSQASRSNAEWMPVSCMKGMNPDWIGSFLAMHTDGIDIPGHGKKGGIAGLLA
jgi:hypothetical protein